MNVETIHIVPVISKYDDDPDIARAHHGSCRPPRKYDDIPFEARRFIAMPILIIAARYSTTMTWSKAERVIDQAPDRLLLLILIPVC